MNLIEDMTDIKNSWHNAFATHLTVRWDANNITTQYGQNVDIVLYGYWEDVDGHNVEEVGAIGLNIRNTGNLTFATASARRLLRHNYQELAVSLFAQKKIKVQTTEQVASLHGRSSCSARLQYALGGRV